MIIKRLAYDYLKYLQSSVIFSGIITNSGAIFKTTPKKTPPDYA